MTREYLHFKIYYKDGSTKEFRNVEYYNWVGWKFLFLRFAPVMSDKSDKYKNKVIEVNPTDFPLGHHSSEWVFIPVKDVEHIETLSQTTWDNHNDKQKYIKDMFGTGGKTNTQLN